MLHGYKLYVPYTERFMYSDIFIESLSQLGLNDVQFEAVVDLYTVCFESKNNKNKKKKVTMSDHGSLRRVERGLTKADIAKIMRFGTRTYISRWRVELSPDEYVVVDDDRHTVIENENALSDDRIQDVLANGQWEKQDRVKITLFDGLYVITDRDERDVITVVNDHHYTTQDIYKMVGDTFQNARKINDAMCYNEIFKDGDTAETRDFIDKMAGERVDRKEYRRLKRILQGLVKRGEGNRKGDYVSQVIQSKPKFKVVDDGDDTPMW